MEALEAAALVARTKPGHEMLLRAVSICARTVEKHVDALQQQVPQIIRQLSEPPASGAHPYLDTEVRMKELMVRLDRFQGAILMCPLTFDITLGGL